MDRLSALDASFLDQERGGAHMHIGAVMVCKGPPPTREEFAAHLESRLDRVPRYRQRLATPPLRLGKPFWIDAPSFDLDYHLRRTALPKPGGIEELRLLAARIFSQRLDRSKPLWELWLVEGLGKGRFALINKTHHALVDGVSGIDVTTALFDLEPSQNPGPPPPGWEPGPAPSRAGLAVKVLSETARSPLRLGRRTADTLAAPADALGRARQAALGVGEIGRTLATGAPRSPINGPIGPHRQIVWELAELDQLKGVKNALGGTVNDVFLAVMAGALGRWLRERGEDTADLRLRACVPVSIRVDTQRGALGNQIAAMFAPLPVDTRDPAERLRLVSEAMLDLKESKQAAGAKAIAGAQEMAPPTILAQASRLQFSSRLYNVLLSNVPGPQFPVYILGRELLEFIPVAFLAPDKRLAVAIVSYNGSVAVSVVADRDHVKDLDDLGEAIRASIREMVEAAKAAAIT